MTKKIYTLLFTMTFITSINTVSAQCDTSNRYQFMHNGKVYYVVMDKQIHTNARACAQIQGGHLVYINDQAEQDAVYNGILAAGVSPTYDTVVNGGGIAYVWIDANDQFTEGDWQWGFNGTSFWSGQGAAGAGGGFAVSGAYHNWGGKSTGTPNEPDDYMNNQDAAGIALASWPIGSSSPLGIAGEWNDIDQVEQLYYVVEIESTDVGDIDNGDNNIEVYPNPAANVLNVKLSVNNKYYTLELINVVGQAIRTISVNDNNTIIRLGNVPAGMYILQAKSENSIHTEQVVISK